MISTEQRFASLRAKFTEHRTIEHDILHELVKAMRLSKATIQRVGERLTQTDLDAAALLQGAHTRMDHVERLLTLWRDRTAPIEDTPDA